MKYRSIFTATAFLGTFLISSGVFATEYLKSQDSFMLAKAVKLGRSSRGGKFISSKPFLSEKQEILKEEKKCVDNCSNCDTTKGKCSACSNGYYLNQDLCLSCSATIEGCSECSSSSKCTKCIEGYSLSENSCKSESCGDEVLKNNASTVAVATDEQSFATAVASGKSIILIENSFSLSSSYSLGTKKLVGPTYYANSACSSKEKPTLTVANGKTLTFGSGGIYNLNVTFNNTSTSVTPLTLSGGTIQNSTITINKADKGIAFSGTGTGYIKNSTIKISEANYAGIYFYWKGTITGSTITINKTQQYGILFYGNTGWGIIENCKVTITQTIKNDAIYMNGGEITNSTIYIDTAGSYAICLWYTTNGTITDSTITVNSSVNGIDTDFKYEGENTITIAGKTTIK